jgi:hypothetical protein
MQRMGSVSGAVASAHTMPAWRSAPSRHAACTGRTHLMDVSQVGVATITWARSPEEEALLRRSLGHLSSIGVPIAVADAGTSPAFAGFLRGLPNVSVTGADGPGLVAQVSASVARAAAFAQQYILYTEPDKELFFRDRLREFLRVAPDEADGGVVLASRSRRSFETFPPMQRYTEGVINRLCGRMIGIAGDYSYGPFLMHAALLPCMEQLDAGLGWGWRHRIFLHTHRQGRRVLHVTDHHPCPHHQRSEDDVERAHRLRQLSQNVLGLVA